MGNINHGLTKSMQQSTSEVELVLAQPPPPSLLNQTFVNPTIHCRLQMARQWSVLSHVELVHPRLSIATLLVSTPAVQSHITRVHALFPGPHYWCPHPLSRATLLVSTPPVQSHIIRAHTPCPEPRFSCPHPLSRATFLVSTPLSRATFLVSTPVQSHISRVHTPVQSHISCVHVHLPHQFNVLSPTNGTLCITCRLMTSYQREPNS